MNDRQAWLDQVIEEPVDTDIRICDPHHHLWDYPQSRYVLDELLADTAGNNVVSTVFIECGSEYREEGPEAMRSIGETDFVEGLAEKNAADPDSSTAVAAGIVSFADLALGDAVAPVLEAHIAASPERFRGIRHICAWHASSDIRKNPPHPAEGLMLDPSFRKGFACLQKYGLSFEAWCYHTQLDEAADLAAAFPEVPIIVNHVGGPLGIGPFAGKVAEVFEDLKPRLAKLAAFANVVIKLGGIAMPLNGHNWHKQPKPPTSSEMAKAYAPYYLFCIEKFGVRRCMFESNFPVDRQSCSYTVLWNAFKQVVSDFSGAEKESLFHDTAARVYKIGGDSAV